MPQSKFEVGDIIEHEDGSLYILTGITETEYSVSTILETNKNVRYGEYQPERQFIDGFSRRWTKIGHIDEAV
jgi:hypothetical protein